MKIGRRPHPHNPSTFRARPCQLGPCEPRVGLFAAAKWLGRWQIKLVLPGFRGAHSAITARTGLLSVMRRLGWRPRRPLGGMDQRRSDAVLSNPNLSQTV